MSIYQIKIRDEEYVGTDGAYIGLAKTAKDAVDKAMKLAKKDHPDCKRLYVSSLECLGSKDF